MRLVLAALLCFVPCALAHAQEPTFGAHASGTSRTARDASDDATAAVTVVPVDPRTNAITTLDALVLEVPGALVRRTGGYGAPMQLSLRGTEPRHTTVWLGSVPLDGVDDAGFDLSTLPPALFDRIEVYRGGAPLWLGSGAIGGALRLVPHHDAGTHGALALGAGSFGLWTGTLRGSAGNRDVQIDSVAGMTTSDGAYPFVDDRGTRFTTADDVVGTRRNGASTDGYFLSRLAARALGGSLELVVLGFGRDQGVPGPALRMSQLAHRTLSRLLLAATFDRPVDDHGRFALVLAATLERHQYSDPLAEVAQLPRQTDDHAVRLYGAAKMSARPTPWLDLAAVLDGRVETLDPHDALAPLAPRPSLRTTGGLGGEARFFGVLGVRPWEARASVRLELIDARLFAVDVMGSDALPSSSSTTLAPTFRLASSFDLADGLALTASFARGVRAPSTLELFGDRGYLVGIVGLKPETSLGGDLGLAFHGRLGPLAGSAELRGFGSYVEDLIAYTRTSTFQSTPGNVSRAALAGVEVGTQLLGWSGRVVLASALTWLVARDLGLGLALPLRPELSAYARLAVRLGPFGPVDAVVPSIDVTYVGASWLDTGNLARVDERLPLGAGLAVDFADARIRIAATLSDLFDVGGTDLLGFPLPGRRFALALTLRD